MTIGVKTLVVQTAAVASLFVMTLNAGAQSSGEQARSLHEAAVKLYEQGRYGDAADQVTHELELLRQHEGLNGKEAAAAFLLLGNAYRDNGSYALSEENYKRAISTYELALGGEHAATVKAMESLANLYRFTGDYEKAEPLFRRALEIDLRVLGEKNYDTATALLNFGNWYSETGSYTQAERFFLRALGVFEELTGNESIETARTLNNIAKLYADTGAYSRAEPLYERSLQIKRKVRGESHPDVARSLNNLGVLYYDSRRFTKAEAPYQRAIEIREAVLGTEHPDTAVSISNLANLYVELGRFAEAETLYNRALEITTKAGKSAEAYLADALLGSAELHRSKGDFAQSERFYRRALELYQQQLENLNAANTEHNLATLYWASGNNATALELLQKTQRVYANNLARFLLSNSEARKKAYLWTLEDQINTHVSFSLALPTRQSIALGMYGVLEIKGRVLDAMSDTVARLLEKSTPKDRALFAELTRVATAFSALTYQGPGELTPEQYREEFNRLQSTQEKLEAQLAAQSSAIRQRTTPISIKAVAEKVPERAALIEFFRYLPFDPRAKRSVRREAKPRYVAYVLKHRSEPTVIDIGDASTLDGIVLELRSSLGLAKPDVRQRSSAVSNRVIAPLYAALDGVDHLIISPDAALNLVPFAALLNADGKYLIQDYTLTYVSSGRDLARLTTDSNKGSGAIIVANPNFGSDLASSNASDPKLESQRSPDLDRGGLVFRPLSNTAAEAQEIGSLLHLPTSSVWLDSSATESRIKGLHGPYLLHIATHGFFLSDQEISDEMKLRSSQNLAVPIGENPLLRSGLALAGANQRRSGPSDDGILTALEAAQLDLRGTELVVLSACDSGVGDVQNGEGVYGLRRALALAGTKTLITSLWRVSDDATRTLMVDYYARLTKGKGRSASLREAQVRMLTDNRFGEPYYWASFIAIGDWRAIRLEALNGLPRH